MKHTSSYAPEDAGIGVQSLEFLRSDTGSKLRDAARAIVDSGQQAKEGVSVAQIAQLRKQYSAEQVHAALTLARLQGKGVGARGKFPLLPFVWATPEALEQATHITVARFKARRYAAFKPMQIVDLCSGIGGDTLGLAEVAPVTAVDQSPVRSACLRYNLDEGAGDNSQLSGTAGKRFPVTLLADDIQKVLPQLPGTALFHIDPARRSGGKRSPRYEELIPGPAVLDQVTSHFAGGAIKLSSAVDFDSLPPGHLELISHRRVVVQAMLWVGSMGAAFKSGTRTASVLTDAQADFSMTGVPAIAEIFSETPIVGPVQGERLILYELDGALTRAGLAGQLALDHGLTPLTSDGGYAIARPGAVVISHVAMVPFAVMAFVPYSIKRVTEALLALPKGDPGAVEVKTRGRLPGIDADELQVAWTRAAPFRRTVLLFSRGKEVMAALADRVLIP